MRISTILVASVRYFRSHSGSGMKRKRSPAPSRRYTAISPSSPPVRSGSPYIRCASRNGAPTRRPFLVDKRAFIVLIRQDAIADELGRHEHGASRIQYLDRRLWISLLQEHRVPRQRSRVLRLHFAGPHAERHAAHRSLPDEEVRHLTMCRAQSSTSRRYLSGKRVLNVSNQSPIHRLA